MIGRILKRRNLLLPASFALTLAVVATLTGCGQSSAPTAESEQAQATEESSSLAQKRTPLEEFRDGFPRELSARARSADLPTLLKGGDESAYMNLRASEFMPTAISTRAG